MDIGVPRTDLCFPSLKFMSHYIVWGLKAKEVKSVDSYDFRPSFFLSKTPFPHLPSHVP